MKKIVYLFIIAALGYFAAVSCSGIANSFTATEREIYLRQNKSDPSRYGWETAYHQALSDNIAIELPYGEKGMLYPKGNIVYSYSFRLSAGERINAVIEAQLPNKIFMELFEWNGSRYERVQSELGALQYSSRTAGSFKLLVQPQIGASGNFALTLNKLPVYGFPVAGKSNGDIGSFWADARDGGKRSHEGIDIFARRGTPVVAVTDGIVTFTGDQGLGGKQVWQRAGLFGNSLYYAHLDRIAVPAGKRLKAGDTIGFVGNTGNAQTTTPHLHFGIYGANGAIDPLPFVFRHCEISAKSLRHDFRNNATVKSQKANLRQGPSDKSATVGQLTSGDQITILGQSHDWLHVLTWTGKKAFVHRKLVRGT